MIFLLSKQYLTLSVDLVATGFCSFARFFMMVLWLQGSLLDKRVAEIKEQLKKEGVPGVQGE